MSALTELVPPKVRAAIYAATAMLAAGWAVAEVNTDLHWGWQAAYAAWNAGAGLLAASNTSSVAQQAAMQRDLDIAANVRAAANPNPH